MLDKNNKIKEVYKKASKKNINLIKSFKTLKNLKFIEFPKLGLDELNKVVKKISSRDGCLLLIDYGYLDSNNQRITRLIISQKK